MSESPVSHSTSNEDPGCETTLFLPRLIFSAPATRLLNPSRGRDAASFARTTTCDADSSSSCDMKALIHDVTGKKIEETTNNTTTNSLPGLDTLCEKSSKAIETARSIAFKTIGEARSAWAARQALRIFRLPRAMPLLQTSNSSESCARSSRTVDKASKNNTHTRENETTAAMPPAIAIVFFGVNRMLLHLWASLCLLRLSLAGCCCISWLFWLTDEEP